MKTTTRNFWIDLLLLVFFCLTIAPLSVRDPNMTAAERGAMQHAHALSGIVLILFSFVHVWQHRLWITAAAAGRLHGKRVKLGMYGLAAVLMVLAFFTGDAGMHVEHVPGLHSIVGYALVAGLIVHIVKHLRRMLATARWLVTPERSRGTARASLSGEVRACRTATATRVGGSDEQSSTKTVSG